MDDQLEALGATGLAVLLRVREAALRTAVSVRLVYSSRLISRMLSALRLDHLFPTYAQLDAALASTAARKIRP